MGTPAADRDELRRAALRYRSLGWSIIPVRGKVAVVPWEQYQAAPPSVATIHRWFMGGNPAVNAATGLAVILGSPHPGKPSRWRRKSDGLVLCNRDWDSEDGYPRWAEENKSLASRTPTARTARGHHCYFYAPPDFENLGNGEYRGDARHYCLLPPSVHPSGIHYEWLRPPPPSGRLPLVTDPAALGLCSGRPKKSGDVTHVVIPSLPGLLCRVPPGGVAAAVSETLPARAGERNACLFRLARRLRALPELAGVEPEALLPVVLGWWRQALPVVETKEWGVTWSAFLDAWGDVLVPEGARPSVEAAWAVACGEVPGGGKDALVPFCRALQKLGGGETFFLDARTLGRLMNTNPMNAWRSLKRLEKSGVLVRMSTGTPYQGGGRANEYQFRGV